MTRRSILSTMIATAIATSIAAPAFALNPQPLPPRWGSKLLRGGTKMLNPQPLPPRWNPGLLKVPKPLLSR